MAAALIAKEHFYVNASFYNDSDKDQEAVIHVQDTTDLLNRSDDWLVHVTRFSCDSMNSLSYIPKDSSAEWEIQVHDANTDDVISTFNFIVDKNYATPRDLIQDMNMAGRFQMGRTKVGGFSGMFEQYRFSIDTGGRFRLENQPDSGGVKDPGHYITYVATPSMNAILGFEHVTSYLRFQPDAITEFCRAIDFLHETCPKVATPAATYQGTYYHQVNDLLIRLLAGAKVQNYTTGNPATIVHTMPNTDQATYLNDINLEQLFVFYKGKTATAVPTSAAGQALFIRGNEPAWVEWLDESHGTQHNVDRGFKAGLYHTYWDQAYAATADDVVATAGIIALRDWPNQALVLPEIHLPYPVFQPGALAQWTAVKYLYPGNSLPGYYLGGTAASGQGGAIAIETEIDRRTFVIDDTLYHVQPGDDMWITNPAWVAGQPPYSSVHQIHSITRSQLQSTVTVDIPIQGNIAELGIVGTDVMFTNRRVPFQSRSMTYPAPVLTYYDAVLNHTVLAMGDVYHSAFEGDFVYFIIQGTTTEMNMTPHRVKSAVVGDPAGNNIIYVDGSIPAGTIHEIFVHKPAADALRWAIDAKNMKMAATTFLYEVKPVVGSTLEGAVMVNDVSYPRQHFQTYNKALLTVQVDEFVKEVRRQHLFDNGSAKSAGIIREKLSSSFIEGIPGSSEIAFPHHSSQIVDFGSNPFKPSDGLTDIIESWGIGTRPVHLINRFPSPFYTVMQPLGPDVYPDDESDFKKSRDFVLNNPNDKPWLRLRPSSISSYLSLRSTLNGQVRQLAPYIIGCDKTFAYTQRDAFIIWQHATTEMDMSHLANQVSNAQHGSASINYGQLTRAFYLCRKELDNLDVVTTQSSKLFGFDGDYIESNQPSHVDSLFPFRQIILTSDDLQQLPEKSQDAASLQPILSSYTLSTFGQTTTNDRGKPAGGSSHPFGSIYFSESGVRRFHHLMKVGGGLRQFRIHAALTYKDDAKTPVSVQLAPGGQFTAQLLFMRKGEAE